jgi:general secretion pathway protein G
MSRDPDRSACRRRPRGAANRGHTLIEALVTLVIMSVLASFGIPRFQQSIEQSRANIAWANLRSIWSAQRLYWLENRSYATDLTTLQTWIPEGSLLPLVDPSLPASNAPPNENAPYIYQVSPGGDGGATATRNGSTAWSGSFTIGADGTCSGSVVQSGQAITIGPTFQ